MLLCPILNIHKNNQCGVGSKINRNNKPFHGPVVFSLGCQRESPRELLILPNPRSQSRATKLEFLGGEGRHQYFFKCYPCDSKIWPGLRITALDEGSAHFSCKWPENKYFRFYGLYSLSQLPTCHCSTKQP